MPKVIKPKPINLNVLLGSVLTTFFCAATNFGCIDSFSSAQFRNEEMMGDGYFGATAAGCFEQ